MQKPSILLIQTGGTFGMLPGGRGFLSGVLRAVPEVRELARISVRAPFLLDSSSLRPEHWIVLARLIAAEIDRYDGFVVTHGTDTMAYTASALSFLLQGLRKPVVLTGAQRPLAEIRNDARTNLIDAVEVATKRVPEVLIVFGGLVLRGNRARKGSISDYRAFQSPNYPPIGDVGTTLRIRTELVRRPRGRFRLREELDARVLHLRLAPGLLGSSLEGLDFRHTRGVVLEAFGAGNVPLDGSREAFPLKRLRDQGVPVFIVSGAEHGSVDLGLYEGGRHARRMGAVPAGDATAEAAVVKLMVALGRAGSAAELRKLLLRDWAGEVTLA